MTGLPALGVVAALAAVVLGLPFGLYALLTRSRRRTMREIRHSTSREGWQFHRSFLRGDPTEFEISGRMNSGVPWIMLCRGTTGYDRGWTVRLGLKFPTLAGEPDVAILPREDKPGAVKALAAQATPEATAKIAKFSGTAADAVEFLRDAPESPSGVAEFDRVYQVTAPNNHFRAPLVDANLAKRILEWPPNAVKAHSVLAWRDRFGLHFQARLAGPPNWETIRYFLEVSEALTQRIPAGSVPSEAHGIVDRLAEKFQRS
jgi:hypothetical protein